MSVILPELPYSKQALSPHISQETLNYHYGKHHQAYVNKLNAQIAGTPWDKANLKEIICSEERSLFNNAAQTWNHTFYWNGLAPKAGGTPKGLVLTAIEASFGDFESFKKEFTKQALSQFGSGWVWLVKQNNALKIISTSNAQTPLNSPQQQALLTCDVWEHAYYIDYKNARNTYVQAFWELINWEFVNKNLDS